MLFKSIAIALTLSITLAHEIKSIGCNAEPGGDFLKYQIEFMEEDDYDRNHIVRSLVFDLTSETGEESTKSIDMESDDESVELQHFESRKKIKIIVGIPAFLNTFTGNVRLHLPNYTTPDGALAEAATWNVANGKAVGRVVAGRVYVD